MRRTLAVLVVILAVGTAADVDVHGDTAYLADWDAGVELVDLSCLHLLFADGFESGDTGAW